MTLKEEFKKNYIEHGVDVTDLGNALELRYANGNLTVMHFDECGNPTTTEFHWVTK